MSRDASSTTRTPAADRSPDSASRPADSPRRRVAVYHPYFGDGGAESVCLHVLEALQDEYDPTLFTMCEVDLAAQNDYFDTAVRETIPVVTLGMTGRLLRASMAVSERAVGRQLRHLHAAVFGRFVRRVVDAEFDLVVGTDGAFVTDLPSIKYVQQYVHYPHSARAGDGATPSLPQRLYDRLLRTVAGDDGSGRPPTWVGNSAWTSAVVESVCDVTARTVYPPVVTDEFDPLPWDDREDGFVCLGRVSPVKNVERNVEIVDRLRERGHDVHLHVVGPATPGDAYADRIAALAATRPHVVLEGAVSRERLVELVTTHRYGLHGTEEEHFGIAVAELVAGGTIPFVPNSGGQTEVVDGLDAVCYDSVADAVSKADAVLSDPGRQRAVFDALPTVDERFGPEGFKRAFRALAAERFEGVDDADDADAAGRPIPPEPPVTT